MRHSELTDQLIDLLLERSVRFGEFTLTSGRKSNWYVDVRTTSMSGDGQVAIGRLGQNALTDADMNPELIGGLTLGADPVAYAIAHQATQNSIWPLDAFTVRKEAKGHGTGKLIEGSNVAGKNVVIIEDVVTTGGSALTAAKAVKEAGGRILGVLAVLDRQEGGREAIEAEGYTLVSLVTKEDIFTRARENGIEVPELVSA